MRNTIAIRLVLGLALLLALFFVAAGMSFWQADAVDEKTEHIVRDLEPKGTVAYEMELNSIETEMAVRDYLRNPDPALRTRIAESSAYFGRLEQEYLRLANPEEIVQVASRLSEYSAGFVKDSKALLNQADVQQSLLKSLNVSNQQKWDTLGAERSGAGWRSGELPEGPVVASSPFGGLSLHLLPAL